MAVSLLVKIGVIDLLIGLRKELLEYLSEKEKELEDVYSLHEEKEEINARAKKVCDELGKGYNSYRNRMMDIKNNVVLLFSKSVNDVEIEEMKLLANEAKNLAEQIQKKAKPLSTKCKQLKN